MNPFSNATSRPTSSRLVVSTTALKQGAMLCIVLILFSQPCWSQQGESPSRLPDQPIPLIPEDQIKPTQPLLELGPGFLGTGRLGRGFDIPTGAVWRPSLWVYGNLRSGINVIDPAGSDNRTIEWANRIDLFANLQFTGTERILLGLQPLQDQGQFTRYTFEPEDSKGWYDNTNLELTTFFFEGELTELFPGLDPAGDKKLDYGFSIGRWTVDLQDGMLVNDNVDAFGVTRFIPFPGASGMRLTMLYGWGELHRDDNKLSFGSRLFGISTETDTYARTIDADLIAVTAPNDQGGDGIYAGLGSSQRIKKWGRTFNTTIRCCVSAATEQDNDQVSDGVLLFAEASTTPSGTDDNAYGTLFLGIDDFASAGRAPAKGGPLGKAGILFAAAGLGSFKPALGNRADRSFGGALGYQWVLDGGEQNFIVEVGGRTPTEGDDPASGAIGVRFQEKLSRRVMIQCDGYTKMDEGGATNNGIRTEFLVRF
ncbi:MAG: hypothetical protein VX764_04560 [Planctomycetota bacterium]|nr:hypothetical protein [Planctomycetota bacterium]